jgi:alcohol dehydrogenase (NADP+)
MPTVYPIVPCHEIVGRVTKIGSAVRNFKPGAFAGDGKGQRGTIRQVILCP